MTVIQPRLWKAEFRHPMLRWSGGDSLASVIAVGLLGQGMRCPSGFFPLVGSAAAGLMVGGAISYGIPGHLRPRLRRWAQKSSLSFHSRHISDERYPVTSRAKVAVTDSAAVAGALLTPIAANRSDALSAKALVVAGELGHYKELLGILHDQVENVTVEMGRARYPHPP